MQRYGIAERRACTALGVQRTTIRYVPKYAGDEERLRSDIVRLAGQYVRQVCDQLQVKIIKGVLSNNHVHMFVEIPPKHSVSDFMRREKGCTSRKIQQEFPELRKSYWGKRFWARGYFCTTSGNVTNEIMLNYIENHTDDEPTDNRR